MPSPPPQSLLESEADLLEAYRRRLLVGLSFAAALALVAGMLASMRQATLQPLEYIGFWVALALFVSAPIALRLTQSTLIAASLLLAGGSVSILLPAYFLGGLQAPQVIWLLVIPMLSPLYFGVRITLASGAISLVAFSALYALEISDALPLPSPDAADFVAFLNLAIAIVFVLAVSISTHRAMRRNELDLIELKDEVERRSDELRESESRKSAIIDSARTGLISADSEQRVLDFNPAAAQILGYSRTEIIGRQMKEFIIPESMRSAHHAAYQQALNKDSISDEPRELIALCADGSQIPVEVVLQRIPVAGPPQFMAQLRDLRGVRRTEAMVRQREAQLHQAQRLEGVGRLAGGVAHDFNNLLTVIGGYSDSIVEDPVTPASIRDQALEVSRAADRAGSITRQLLAFSRGQDLALIPVDLEQLLIEFQHTLRALLPEKVKLVTEFAAARWPVQANPTEVERIVLNLVMNAADAMPEGGQLILTTEYLKFEYGDSTLPADLSVGRYARLRVSDDGVGMTPEVLSQAFEPFFTTKEVGKGTGLGLASVYGLVRQFGGHIDIESAPGRGTRVSIYLSEGSGDATEASLAQPPAEAGPMPGLILLAEDESSVRKLIANRLRSDGFHVLEAADGDEALAVATSQDQSVDLLICDVVMPNRSGTGLARELRKLRPNLPVVFISGFLGDLPSDFLQDFEAAEFLHKPLRLERLTETVRRLLRERAPEADAPASSSNP